MKTFWQPAQIVGKVQTTYGTKTDGRERWYAFMCNGYSCTDRIRLCVPVEVWRRLVGEEPE